jgi:hypothetical protein
LSSVSESTKNDQAWEKLFEKYRILSEIKRNGCFKINATQINPFREARLMTKFDHRIQLPQLFAENGLAILPVTRGNYVISHFAAYYNFTEADHQVQQVVFPEYLESIDHNNISSEAMAINCAYVSNIFTDFLEDSELLPTVNGRMGSKVFSYYIKNTVTHSNVLLTVNNAQLEIDGGYEGLQTLSIIEAKNYISDDFLIRQLYYPFRLWTSKVAKRVKPIFLIYSNGIFSLYEFEFEDPNHYNSLVLVRQKNYSFESLEIDLDDILAILNKTITLPEPEIAFPQANSFKRIINLCELLSEKEMSRDEITTDLAFDSRQTNYYTDAGRYLGLIDKRSDQRMPVYYLSENGRKILKQPYRIRQLSFVGLILNHRVFKETLQRHLDSGVMPSKPEIVAMMQKGGLYNIQRDSTFERRASTVSGWVNWILELQRE